MLPSVTHCYPTSFAAVYLSNINSNIILPSSEGHKNWYWKYLLVQNSKRASCLLGDSLSLPPLFQKMICNLQIRNLCLRIPQTLQLYRHKQRCMRPVSSPMLQSLPLIVLRTLLNYFFLNCPLFRFFVFPILIVFETFSVFIKSFYPSCLLIFIRSLFCLIYFGYFLTFLTSNFFLHISFISLSIHSFRFFPSHIFLFSFHILSMFFSLYLFHFSFHTLCMFIILFTVLYPFFFNRSCFSRNRLIILTLLPSLRIVSFLILLRFISSCPIFYALWPPPSISSPFFTISI